MIIEKLLVSEISAEPAMADLLTAYAAESAIAGMPKAIPSLENYQILEEAGLLHVFGAYHEGSLIGFLCLLLSRVPHYNAIIGSSESFFVAEQHRKTGAGLALLKEAERFAKSADAVGMFVSAPQGSKLADVMTVMPSYCETNRVFFRPLNHV